MIALAGLLLMSGFMLSFMAALATGEWRYLILTVICYLLLGAKAKS
jgi:hypothetical protein